MNLFFVITATVLFLFSAISSATAIQKEPAPQENSPDDSSLKETVAEPEPSIIREVENIAFDQRVGRVLLSWDLDDTGVDHIEIFGKYFNDEHPWRYDGFHKMTRAVELHLDPLAEVELRIVLVFADGTRSPGKTVKVTARHKNVVSDEYQGRRLDIYLPQGYHEEEREYPVIYMHDGQNLFSPRLAYIDEWQVDETMDRLTDKGLIDKCIVVGIWNSSKRAEEYTPFADRRFGGGQAREFSDYVVHHIIPYVEKKYRVSRRREDRAVMGSSFGGILSLWMGYTYPHVFSMVGAISPSLWIADGAMLRELEERPKRNIKIWIDQGTGEWSDFTRNAVNILVRKGYKYGSELLYYEVKDAVHNERHWAERIDCPFVFFKGSREGRIEKIRLDIQKVPHFFAGPKKYVINPVGYFDNGIWYSLYTSAKYSIEGKSGAFIDRTGVLQFNNAREATVKVLFDHVSEKVHIVNEYYKSKPSEATKTFPEADKTGKKEDGSSPEKTPLEKALDISPAKDEEPQ